MSQGPTIAEIVKLKEQRCLEVGRVLDFYQDKQLPPKAVGELQELMDRQEFRLRELVLDCKSRELDVKIETMEKILKLIKSNEPPIKTARPPSAA